ncbi:DUF4230 domain-containing protein [Novosphingobium huizhouense]|uniref:DUF4230 domain-containing protein n=1 Tax=Novosphingobium huizhouense TaxID=2866625 RepID=UPI001CD86C8F|nr:DUF4230 domain-containing protein [Novosphingobium huizhouense]
MEPDLTPSRPAAPAAAPAPARASALPWLLFVGALAIAAFLAWKLWRPADIGDPLATSLVAFEKQNTLTVFSAQLAPVVSSDDARLFGLVKAKQVAVIPARVDYTLDLSGIGRERMRWNSETKTLAVRLPPLAVSRPNLDEARAQYLREGVWIGREAQDKLTRDNTRLAERLAVEQAANPVLMNLARGAAKDAIRQNLAIPLQVAGYGDVKVVVAFDGEPTPM